MELSQIQGKYIALISLKQKTIEGEGFSKPPSSIEKLLSITTTM